MAAVRAFCRDRAGGPRVEFFAVALGHEMGCRSGNQGLGIVIRVDSAYSNEGIGVQMMIAQPFQF